MTAEQRNKTDGFEFLLLVIILFAGNQDQPLHVTLAKRHDQTPVPGYLFQQGVGYLGCCGRDQKGIRGRAGRAAHVPVMMAGSHVLQAQLP